PVSVLMCVAFSSSSVPVMLFFFSGLSLQYMSRAAFLTLLSKRDSRARLRTSSLFSAVMPRHTQDTQNTHTQTGHHYAYSVTAKLGSTHTSTHIYTHIYTHTHIHTHTHTETHTHTGGCSSIT